MLEPEFNKQPDKRKLPFPELSLKDFKTSPEVAKKNYELANNLCADLREGNQILSEENQKLRLDNHQVERERDLFKKDIEFFEAQERSRSGMVTFLTILSLLAGASISLGSGYIPIAIDASIGKVLFTCGIIVEIIIALLFLFTRQRRGSK